MLESILEPVAEEYDTIILIFLTLMGACIGSFLNVVVYRLPRGLSVQDPPRSFCPSCGAAIPWWLNLPIISWLWLRGKSACCHKPISVRYWLVEVACAGLFFLIGWHFTYESVLTQLWLCLWAAGLLALLAMDWEEMVVHPWVAVFAGAFGFTAAIMDPTLVDSSAITPQEGALWGGVGAAGGYLVFRLVALGGRLLFGKRSRSFCANEKWTLRQVGEDIVLTVAGKDYAWSETLPEDNCCVLLRGATVSAYPQCERGLITLKVDSMRLPDGQSHDLARHDLLTGECQGITICREAMGSGDAWLAMAIGALCGWQGVLFALVGGSVIGILFALVMRIRRGVPMPFGPSLILAAYVWLFWGPRILEFYVENACK